VTGRQWGKTHAIINWLAENPQDRGVIVTDQERKRYILSRIRQTPLYRLGKMHWDMRIISLGERTWLRGSGVPFRSNVRELAIDDFDDVLRSIFDARVDFVTGSGTLIAPPAMQQYRTDYVDSEVDEWPDQPSIEGARYDPR